MFKQFMQSLKGITKVPRPKGLILFSVAKNKITKFLHPSQSIDLSNKDIRQILIVKIYGVGNMVLFTPALQAIREKFPQAEITLMADDLSAVEVVKGSGLYDHLILINEDQLDVANFVKDQRKKDYDLVLVSYPMVSEKISLIAGLLRARYKVAHRIQCCLPSLYSIVLDGDLFSQHEVAYNFDLLRCLGLTVDESQYQLKISIPNSEQEFANNFLNSQGVKETDVLIGMHPGSLDERKRWDTNKFTDLGNQLCQRPNTKIILFGGPKETQLAAQIASQMKCPTINATGKTTLKQAAALIKACSLFVSNDSGLMHIASAVKTPVVAIFGPTNHIKNAPFGNNYLIVRKNLECSPCYRFSINCNKDFQCLKSIEIEDVLVGINKLMLRKK